jgi:hypothetical protein
MDELEQDARTVGVKACTACASGLLERDNFCRWCGVRQPGNERLAPTRVQEMSTGTRAESRVQVLRCATVAFESGARADVYRRISGPLVTAVVSGALSVPSTENQSPFVKRAILALISIPIWLIIILLSPLDAYAAVKNLAGQV